MRARNPAAAILPYKSKLGFYPGNISLNMLDWPLGRPDRLLGNALTIKDMENNDHLIIQPSKNSMYIHPVGLNLQHVIPPRVSIMVMEPYAIHKRHIENLKKTFRRFENILCGCETLLKSVPNGILLPFGTTWITDPLETAPEKNKMCSIIASQKHDLPGQALRHEIIKWAQNDGIKADAIGSGYRPFHHKWEGLAPYCYSVVIENVREANYFTEKLIDAILCGTVPIYWGCPNIGDYFDKSGIVICESKEDILSAMRDMSMRNYRQRLPGLLALRKRALYWSDLHGRAARAVLKA
ncbi:MAG: hypothetical protein OXE85_06395 [Roseovarius sp.]|nr:hypothetical protein [Roseovarius sp.]